LGYFCNLQNELPKVNNHPEGQNWPNLVTLPVIVGIQVFLSYRKKTVTGTRPKKVAVTNIEEGFSWRPAVLQHSSTMGGQV
jgi:hypothetical protein